MLKILQDALERPELFYWFGRIEPADLEAWLKEQELTIPEDLFTFWSETGGGDLFDTETIYGPFDPEYGEEVLGCNEYAWSKGLSTDFLLFFGGKGDGLSAVRRHDQRFVELSDPDYSVVREYESFDEWYTVVLRNRFAEFYKLL